jgi:hypothetical protein
MPDSDSYDLIAYDIETQQKVLHWRSVAENPGAVYTVGSTIIDDPNCWLVVSIRRSSTSHVMYVDVRRASRL